MVGPDGATSAEIHATASMGGATQTRTDYVTGGDGAEVSGRVAVHAGELPELWAAGRGGEEEEEEEGGPGGWGGTGFGGIGGSSPSGGGSGGAGASYRHHLLTGSSVTRGTTSDGNGLVTITSNHVLVLPAMHLTASRTHLAPGEPTVLRLTMPCVDWLWVIASPASPGPR